MTIFHAQNGSLNFNEGLEYTFNTDGEIFHIKKIAGKVCFFIDQ